MARLLRDFEASTKTLQFFKQHQKRTSWCEQIAQLPLLYSNLYTENISAQRSPLPEVRVHGSEILAVCLGGDAPMGSRPRLGPSPLRLPCAGLGVSGSVELVACLFFEQLWSSIDDQQKY